MACSPAQRAANVRNSKLSTGPRSELGRRKVAVNALKHGLTGAGVAVPDEDVLVVQERFEQFDAALNPNQVISEFLIRHLVLMSIRMERCVRYETASISRNMLQAEQVESDIQREQLQKRVDWIAADPAFACHELERLPRGIDWMVRNWQDLQAQLLNHAPDDWSFSHMQMAMNLMGMKIDHLPKPRVEVLSEAVRGRFQFLQPSDWPDLPPMDRRLAARDELSRLIGSEIARLEAAKAKLDKEALAKIEAGAMARALFDPSKDAVLARKYEAAASREFYKALRTVIELNKSLDVESTDDIEAASPETEKDLGQMALNFPGEIPTDRPKRPEVPDRRKSRRDRGRKARQKGSGPRRG